MARLLACKLDLGAAVQEGMPSSFEMPPGSDDNASYTVAVVGQCIDEKIGGVTQSLAGVPRELVPRAHWLASD
jgi:hypothetical protein